MIERSSSDAAVRGNPDTPIPEGLLYTREMLEEGMRPGLRPVIPNWHLVDGVLKMTYWHAVKYYAFTLCYAERARVGCTIGEAKEWVEGYQNFRNRRLEDVLKWLLEAYPPFVQGVDARFAQYRPFELVRNRTSECPQPPPGDEVPPLKPYVLRSTDWYLKKSWLKGIFLGEPEPFFKFLRDERQELSEGIAYMTQLESMGHGKTVREVEPLINLAKIQLEDIDRFLIKYDA